jgi:hypothetical protein
MLTALIIVIECEDFVKTQRKAFEDCTNRHPESDFFCERWYKVDESGVSLVKLDSAKGML